MKKSMPRFKQPQILVVLSLAIAFPLWAEPPKTGIYPGVEQAASPDPSWFKQPESLVEDLQRIQTGTPQERLQALAKKVRHDMVFVGGGEFLMGDFGELQSEEQLFWTSTAHNKPLREVKLTGYSISKYKVTYAEFDLYSEVNQKPKVGTKTSFAEYRKPDVPAGVNWYQARDYCRWLGKIAKLPIDLPTEAQWEYAARNHGQFIGWPTDNGWLIWDWNVPSAKLVEKLMGNSSWLYPIALFPSNPLGLHDLAANGLEWVEDWFQEKYYLKTPKTVDPRGPKAGKFKVLRGWPEYNNDLAGMSMDRRYREPQKKPAYLSVGSSLDFHRQDAFRCAIQAHVR